MKYLLSLTPIALFPLYVYAEDLSTKVNLLEKEVFKLQKELKLHQEDLDERLPIIEKNEKHSILDKINLSPEILLRIDKLDYASGLIGSDGDKTLTNPSDPNSPYRRDRYTKNFDAAGYVRFRLNMNAQYEDLKFYGRFLYANSSQSHQRLCILSRDIKTAQGGSALDIDRAYIDYTPNKQQNGDFTLSFGILPTTGGTPMHFAQNKQRSSMFPALVFDMNTYGVIATQNFTTTLIFELLLQKPIL